MHSIKLKDKSFKDRVLEVISSKDPKMSVDPEGNDTTIWVHTDLTDNEIEAIGGVKCAIYAHGKYNKPCPCGSGEPSYPLEDARGIFCSYVCEACEEEVKGRYRPEIFEDSYYECQEPIEEDY